MFQRIGIGYRWVTDHLVTSALCLVGLGVLLSILSFLPTDEWWRTAIAGAAGIGIGLGLNLLILAWVERPKENSAASSGKSAVVRSRGWGVTALVFFAAYLSLLIFAPKDDFFLALSVTCLAFGVPAMATSLDRYYPGEYAPGWFLFPFFCDAMMLTAVANLPSADGRIAGIALLFPGLVAAFVVTLWAHKIRTVGRQDYVKGTETARGILGAWALIWLMAGFYSMNDQPFSTEDPLSPLTVLMGLVTIGSVMAAITSGYTQYIDASQALGHDQLPTLVVAEHV